VVTAIAPGNLAAFPPSPEVNADFAWSKNLSMQVEKKVTKEKTARLPPESLGTSCASPFRVQCMQIGYPADLSYAPHFYRWSRADLGKSSGARRGKRD